MAVLKTLRDLHPIFERGRSSATPSLKNWEYFSQKPSNSVNALEKALENHQAQQGENDADAVEPGNDTGFIPSA